MSQRRGFLLGFGVCLLGFLPLLNLGSCADDLTGPRGQDAAATPNISIRGGGTITWSSETGQISFTENIVIRDHSLGSVYTVTPTASPITLSQVNDISYVEVVRDVALEEEITETRQVESGSIDVQAANAVAVTLFERSEIDVIYIPWVQKELVTGDEWRFGTALSWYESRATQSKPGYRSAGGSEISVSASSGAPAVVRIAGKIYVNLEPYTIDFSGSGAEGDGRGGLEPDGIWESSSAYYVYAVPSGTDRTFDVVGSLNSPPSGLADFNDWSYLGACATAGSVAFEIFKATNGIFMAEAELEAESVSETTDVTSRTFSSMPLTVINAYFRGQLNFGGAIAGGVADFGTSSDITEGFGSLVVSTSAIGQGDRVYGWIPIETAQTVYFKLNDSGGTTARLALQGWQEEPLAYK